jgi:hypothetical protein
MTAPAQASSADPPGLRVRFPAVEAFYFIGGALAVLALIVSAIGITSKGFPGSIGVERAIALVFAVMVVAAVGAAVVGAANESDEEHEEESALVLPR